MARTSFPLFALIALMALGGQCAAQQDTTYLRFQEYPAADVFTGTPKPANLASDPKARLYRTVLRQQGKLGPNFAGHYTIVTWGCGSSCEAFAIVDARDGHVFFSDELPYVSWGGWWGEDYGLKYRVDSRLLAVYGRRMEEDTTGIFYYLWNGTKLEFLKRMPKTIPLPDSLR